MRSFLLITFLVSCSSAPIVPGRPVGSVLEAQSGHGRVYFSSADELADARECAAEIDRSFLSTAELLGFRSETPLEVWLNYGLGNPGAGNGNHLEVNPSSEWSEGIGLVMAHELVHWHAVGTAINLNLPHYIEEGICEVLSSELNPAQGQARKDVLNRLLRSLAAKGGLAQVITRLGQDLAEAKADRPTGTLEIAALGFRLVEQIGFEVLREAAIAGPVTPEMVLEMAGVDREGCGLNIPPAQAAPVPEPVAYFLDASGNVLQSVPVSSYGSTELPPGTVSVEVGVHRTDQE